MSDNTPVFIGIGGIILSIVCSIIVGYLYGTKKNCEFGEWTDCTNNKQSRTKIEDTIFGKKCDTTELLERECDSSKTLLSGNIISNDYNAPHIKGVHPLMILENNGNFLIYDRGYIMLGDTNNKKLISNAKRNRGETLKGLLYDKDYQDKLLFKNDGNICVLDGMGKEFVCLFKNDLTTYGLGLENGPYKLRLDNNKLNIITKTGKIVEVNPLLPNIEIVP